MDSIEKINQHNLKHHIKHNTVVLKKKRFQTRTVSYIVVASYPEELEVINSTQELTKALYEKLKDEKIITLDEEITSVIFYGNLEKFKSYHKVVYMFPQRLKDIRERREPQFRLYTRTLEEQKNAMWLLNLCNCAKNSWLSALTKIGTHYGLVLKIEKTNGDTL